MTIKKQWYRIELLNNDGILIFGYDRLSNVIYYDVLINIDDYRKDIEKWLENAKNILLFNVTIDELINSIKRGDNRVNNMIIDTI